MKINASTKVGFEENFSSISLEKQKETQSYINRTKDNAFSDNKVTTNNYFSTDKISLEILQMLANVCNSSENCYKGLCDKINN